MKQVTAGDPEVLLGAFRQTGIVDRLLELATASGRDPATYRRVAAALAPVLEPLAHGEYPRYDDLEPAVFARDAEATAMVLRWAAGSDRADLRGAALGTMGKLGWDEFTGDLTAAARSPEDWERLAAIDALGRSSSLSALALLEELCEHPDPETRAAARAELKRRR